MSSYFHDEEALARTAIALGASSGAGVRVAILDSGVDTAHPALEGLSLADDVMFEAGGNFLESKAGNGDAIGHGTAIAWIIRRLAPCAEIGSFRVLDGALRSRSTVIWEAARLALERGYQILNCSFGSPGEARFVMPYKEWTDAAYLSRAHIVAACSNDDAGLREWPGWFPTVLTVNLAALDHDGWEHRTGAGMVEFAARGFEVTVPWQGGWKKVTGSSFAAPVVSAWLARLVSLQPDLSVEQAKELMRRLAGRRM
ncbi:MAG TPA: alkaline serine protease [Verrucomicrobiales bacterium]|nr:alkaline serine protease [Verrucomicrobiales bacterium]HCN75683.1 alkaline serine protease [Verrucomicrobiales bacterium]HRJ08238.1 S8 family serine peptidase [Prosthecobacter sp.]HRK16480.1 S8 family serine peptidase [Prosthecobacter sp.]